MPDSTTRNHGRCQSTVAAVVCATVAGLAFTLAQPTAAVAASPADAEASLLKAEDQLFQADVQHDTAAIARGFADEAIFVHANGMVQTKADYLQATAKAAFPIKSIETANRVVRIFGNVGVIRGTKNLVVGDMHLSGSYLTVYIMRDGRWQMLDEQSAPAPPAPAGK
jgi:ribulose 1,5-bisphosphate carboxylase large subunit-like protein